MDDVCASKCKLPTQDLRLLLIYFVGKQRPPFSGALSFSLLVYYLFLLDNKDHPWCKILSS